MSRFTKRDLANATGYQTKRNDLPTRVVNKSAIIYYTIFGKHTFTDEEGNPVIEDEKKAYAKVIQNRNGTTYYIKVESDGRPFDPLGLYASREEHRLNQVRGKDSVRFTKTNEVVYNFYIKYLRTKNRVYLKNAERNM
jgi:hypothetical protein